MEVSEARDNTQGAEGSGKLFTGVLNMAISAINPSKAEMEEMGMNPKEEPDYFLKDKDDKTKVDGVRIAFFLEGVFAGEKIKTVLNIYLRKTFIESKKEGDESRHMYIDKFGKTCFEKKSDVDMKNVSASWVDVPSLKLAVGGESELIDFIRCFLGHQQTDVCKFTGESLREIFAGNITTIKNVIKSASAVADNMVRVLLGVRDAGDGKFYQTVYSRKFERPYSRTSKYIHKPLAYSKGENNVDYCVDLINFNEEDFNFKEYVATIPSGTSAAASVTSMPSNPIVVGLPSDDDLPF